MQKFIVLLNHTGDVCISWDEDQDTTLRTYIQKKIDQGYIFFITERKFFNLVQKKTAIKSVNQIGVDRKVYLDDSDAEELANEKKISISHIQTSQVDTIKKATSAQEVVTSGAAVAVRPARGG